MTKGNFLKDSTVVLLRSTYRVEIVGRSHGFRVLRPADAIVHHTGERHRLELLHVGTSIDHLLLVLAPPAAPHAQKHKRQHDDDDGGHRCADGNT